MTNTDMSDTIVNATCQYYSGNITFDMSDNRLIFFLHLKKIQTMSTVAIAYKLVLIISKRDVKSDRKFISSPYNQEYTICIFLYSFNFNAFSDFLQHYVIAIHPPAKTLLSS